MADILGKALLDYYQGNYSEDLLTETNISEEDELPLPYLFRSYDEMPLLEQKALDLAQGRVLDVGCGAGSHSLYLQQKGMEVHAIDISKGAVEVATRRGVEHARTVGVMELQEGSYDTILLLMNGVGIFQRIDNVANGLKHLAGLLAPGGQILVDSSDLQYMYNRTEEGGIMVPADRYYGELDFVISYKGISGEPFPWLYLDERRFQQICEANTFGFELVERGDHFDYLARITIGAHSPS
ncbi:MAG: class I SAM-dependent methyltransferase [Bacteroidota bacterium]